MKIYVASSWRNEIQPDVVKTVRSAGLETYDFRHPVQGDHGFHWSEIDPAWKDWDFTSYRKGLAHPLADKGFLMDMNALRAADATLLVLPCGRSAHLELGCAVGLEQETAIYLPEDRGIKIEPELMNKMVGQLLGTMNEVLDWAERLIGKSE